MIDVGTSRCNDRQACGATYGWDKQRSVNDGRTYSWACAGLIIVAYLLLAPSELRGAARANRVDSVWGTAGADEGLRQAFECATYSLRPSGHGTWRGANPSQRLTLEFNTKNARITHRDGIVDLQLTGYGRGDRLRKPAHAKLTSTANRVEYQREDITEWYLNTSRGLEQGFALAQRPRSDREGEPLLIALRVSGGLHPFQGTGDESVLFRSSSGVVLRYDGLRAVDARGHILPSRLELRGGEIRLIVADRDAQYPLVVDPIWTQQQELTASDGVPGDVLSGATGDEFGYSVSVSGDTAVIGARGRTVNSQANQGAAYVFVRSGGLWTKNVKEFRLYRKFSADAVIKFDNEELGPLPDNKTKEEPQPTQPQPHQ